MNSTTDLRLKALSKIYCSGWRFILGTPHPIKLNRVHITFIKFGDIPRRTSDHTPELSRHVNCFEIIGVSWFKRATFDDNYLTHTELVWDNSEDNSTGLNTCPLIPSDLRACKLALWRSCEATCLSWHNFKANKNRSRKIFQSTPREKEVFPSPLPPTQIFLRLYQAFLPHELS